MHISHWQAPFHSIVPLPYIIEQSQFKVDDMKYSREDLGLDKEMVIFSRYGGQDTWNLPLQVKQLSVAKEMILGLYLNTQPFINHQELYF